MTRSVTAMSDPATEAAQRAAIDGRLRDDLMIHGLSVREFGAEAAREALAPIRELIAELSTIGDAGVDLAIDRLCPLVYTTDELGGE